MRRLIWIACSIIAVAGIAFGIGHQPAPVSAGGFPCFLCHGVNFEGSDLAPTVAGTKLTDEQILKQIRTPRGMMPAFPDFATDSTVQFIRSQPTGQPTMTLSDQQRSAVLALIAGVAAARATEYARRAGSSAIEMPTPLPQTPTPVASPTPTARAIPNDSSLGFGVTIGTVLIAGAAMWWQWLRRS